MICLFIKLNLFNSAAQLKYFGKITWANPRQTKKVPINLIFNSISFKNKYGYKRSELKLVIKDQICFFENPKPR